jgi:LysM repeat protein
MQLSLKSLLLFLLFFVCGSYVMGQNEPVTITISKEKTNIDGKTYYLHTIKQGETLYSLCKAYNVTQKDITDVNPEAATTLKVGEVIKIIDKQAPATTPLKSDEYIYHIVEAGQTVYSIAEKYGFSKEEIYKVNPGTDTTPLQLGQVIRIPKSRSTQTKVISTASFDEYKVKKKDTLYSIAHSYGVSIDDIIALNPELNTSDIKKGQIIKIPTGTKPVTPVNNAIVADTVKEPVVVKTLPPCSSSDEHAVHNVAFLLPLFLDENKSVISLDSAGANKNNDDKLIYSRSKGFIEFYEGALLAIDSLKKAGHSYKIYVYDTGRDLKKLTSILNRKELAEMELFIGPFDSTLIEKALSFANANNIKVVSPLSQNINILKSNPNLFQVNPPEYYKIDSAVKYLATQKNKNIILIKSNRASDKEITTLFEEKLNLLKSEGVQYKVHSGSNNGLLTGKLTTDKENLLIMPSNEEAAVSDLLRNINYVNDSYKITVFGLTRWTTFSNIDINYLHNLQFEYYTSFFADYNKNVTKQFVLKMRQNFKTEPTAQSFTSQGYSYAFLGYDITYYFLSALAKYGRNFEGCLSNHKVDLIQSDIHFVPAANGDGAINKTVNVVRYNKDFTITKIH